MDSILEVSSSYGHVRGAMSTHAVKYRLSYCEVEVWIRRVLVVDGRVAKCALKCLGVHQRSVTFPEDR